MGILTTLSAVLGSDIYMRNKFNDAIHTEEWKNGNPTSIMLRTKLAKEYIANHPSDFDYADSQILFNKSIDILFAAGVFSSSVNLASI